MNWASPRLSSVARRILGKASMSGYAAAAEGDAADVTLRATWQKVEITARGLARMNTIAARREEAAVMALIGRHPTPGCSGLSCAFVSRNGSVGTRVDR